MTTFADMQQQAEALHKLSRELGPLAEAYEDTVLRRLLKQCRWDPDFAAIALRLSPRPQWVERVVGLVHDPREGQDK